MLGFCSSRSPSVSWMALFLALVASTKRLTSVCSFVPVIGEPARARSSSRSTITNLRMMSTTATKPTVLVPIADGSEEIETTCITDTLTRFGAHVTVASVQQSLLCTMSRGIKIQADCSIAEAALKEWDLIALPGGMPGAEHLRDNKELTDLLKKQKDANKAYGAICAAPAVVLATHGLIDGAATCYPAPAFREKLFNASDQAVVHDGNLTTSQGPGTALTFALDLGEKLFGKEKRDEIAKQMLFM